LYLNEKLNHLGGSFVLKESELDFTGTKEMLLAIISGAVIYILKSFKFISFNLILNG
jgi:hypothetical protein